MKQRNFIFSQKKKGAMLHYFIALNESDRLLKLIFTGAHVYTHVYNFFYIIHQFLNINF